MLDQIRPVLAVPDLAASAAWYRDVLGFAIREIGDAGWRFYERDGCIIMAGECRDAIPPRELGDHAYAMYLVVADAATLYAQARAAGGEVIKPLRDEPWGMREFALRSIDGHRLMIGQRIA